MTYNERIDICRKLLSDMRDMMPDDEGRDELSRVLAGLSEYVGDITDRLFPHPPKYVTKDEAYGRLLEEYTKALEEGDDTVASMSINEWMNANRYVIVDDGDARLESSSGGDDGGSVNSRTPF